MNKHIILIMLVVAMSGCTIWKHQTKLTGEGEVDLLNCKQATTKLACNLGLENNSPFVKKQISKCMAEENGWVKVEEYHIHPPRNYLFVSYLNENDVWSPNIIPCTEK